VLIKKSLADTCGKQTSDFILQVSPFSIYKSS